MRSSSTSRPFTVKTLSKKAVTELADKLWRSKQLNLSSTPDKMTMQAPSASQTPAKKLSLAKREFHPPVHQSQENLSVKMPVDTMIDKAVHDFNLKHPSSGRLRSAQ